jgi:nucleotide-binding universal stress UspA family protein
MNKLVYTTFPIAGLEGGRMMHRKILVPLDGSPLAESALPHAQKLAQSEEAEIVILRVPMLPHDGVFSRHSTAHSKSIEDVEEESKAYIDAEVLELRGKGITVLGITRDGPVAETILSVAQETHADIIAMSTHDRTGWRRLLAGSVTQQVIHHSPIPVAVIHPN